ncbi:superoxide dismutase family protein [Cohnella faecalis]|uniref:Superoxide dismutase n=1 Tax=Cohnella faecalis TaxID=2315694 RepID=A0A398CQK3_9BACL|nr:superoxide dismutase family protein [Cohnella faecalis]RIE02097.1 superoxide dismutase [Cohnella faecalis]
MKRKIDFFQVTAAFLCGSVFFSGIALAQTKGSISVSPSKLRFLVQGTDRSSSDGQFANNGVAVPESLQYKGTTYVPIRLAANLIETPVYWDGETRSVWIGEAEVRIVNGAGAVIGEAKLSEQEGGVHVHLTASQLSPGKHGLHLHEKNFENNDFKTAGGHYNPTGKKHGHNNPEGHHAGDFANLEAGADGTAHAEFVIEGMTLEKGKENSVWGRSLLVHATEDDGKTDPSGNSGDRVAGGNIR